VPVDAPLGSFAQVVPEVPPVGDLECLRCPAGGAFSEKRNTIAADDLDAGMLGEPRRRRVRLPVRQEVHRATCLDVDEHSSVDPALAVGVFIHADHAGCRNQRIR
jgi:hypothetical protein